MTSAAGSTIQENVRDHPRWSIPGRTAWLRQATGALLWRALEPARPKRSSRDKSPPPSRVGEHPEAGLAAIVGPWPRVG